MTLKWRFFLWITLSIVLSMLLPFGTFTLDEGVQLLQALELVREGEFYVYSRWGADSYPFLEVKGAVTILEANQAGLLSQYPPAVSLLSLPFTLTLGERAFYFINVFSLFLVIEICSGWLKRQNSERKVVHFFVLFFVPPFLIPAFSIWPHSLATLFVVGAWRLVVSDIPIRFSFLAGLLVGVGVGVRLDVVIVATALLCWLLLFRRWRCSLALCLGGTLPALLLSFYNQEFRSVFFPIAYSSDPWGALTRHAWYLLAPFAVFACFLLLRDRLTFSLDRRWLQIVALASLLAMCLGFSEQLQGVYSLLFHFDYQEPRYSLAPLFQIIGATPFPTFASYKLSLFQLSPILALGFGWVIRECFRDFERASLLGIIPLFLILFFGSQNWHGGLSFDMRYLNPTLPFFAMAAAFFASEFTPKLLSSRYKVLALSLVGFALVGIARIDWVSLDVSTILAIICALVGLFHIKQSALVIFLSTAFTLTVCFFQTFEMLYTRSVSASLSQSISELDIERTVVVSDGVDLIFPARVNSDIGFIQLDAYLSRDLVEWIASFRSNVLICCIYSDEHKAKSCHARRRELVAALPMRSWQEEIEGRCLMAGEIGQAPSSTSS